jgi:murein DD-endopeptidase MepM/ murein hydrolase activator NlpD
MIDPLLFMKIRDGAMSNTFGMVRTDSNGNPKPHQGWDLEALVGTYVLAVGDGTIVWTRNDGDYGNQVLLAFAITGGVTRYAFYAHLRSFNVKAGQQVEEGELIGATGQTGNAAGTTPHLHFEIRDTDSQGPGLGLVHRIDPSTLLGPAPLAGRSVPGQWSAGGYVSYVQH